MYILIFMTAMMVLIGVVLASMQYVTKPLLTRNAELLRNRVFCRAFGFEPLSIDADGYKKLYTDSIIYDSIAKIYSSRDGSKIGYEFIASGFWDKIRGIMVLDSSLTVFKNIQFLEQHETPGLGARIEEDVFTNQFNGIEIDWKTSEGRYIEIGGTPSADKKNRVDAITGATQTSLALMKGLNTKLTGIRKR
jgi:Na+-transporting NADH:ubiquinone oxidoreductase subunit C